MDVWISRVNKSVKCDYCGELIENGSPGVFGKLWKSYTTEGTLEVRKWTRKFHWHAKRKRDDQCCYLVQGLERMEKEPYVEKRGRKTIVMPKEMRAQRRLLLCRRGRVMQRLREEMAGEARVDLIIKLGTQLETLKEEILPLGGVPKSWE